MAKAPADIRSLARAHTKTALNVLVSIARGKNFSEGARVSASIALIDRGWGKPAQPHTGDGENPIEITIRKMLSDE